MRWPLQVKPLWIFTHEQMHVHIECTAGSAGAGCCVLCNVNAEPHRMACLVGDSNVLRQAVQQRRFPFPVCAAADTRLPEVAVTSSWTHYEDQVSMLSKCHGVAGEFIKIRLFHQMPQKSIFQTRVKYYVQAILYFFTSLE